MELTLSINDKVFQKFCFKLADNSELLFLDELNDKTTEIVENWMRAYVEDRLSVSPPIKPPTPTPVEMLLRKCAHLKVGELVRIVMRELLERGVATDRQIVEFQKASGNVPVKKYHVPYGLYVKNQFNTTFPLLLDETHWEEYDKTDPAPKFLKQPLFINGKKFYLSAQWFIRNREPMEHWIRENLTIWLKETDEQSRNEMIHWIENF